MKLKDEKSCIIDARHKFSQRRYDHALKNQSTHQIVYGSDFLNDLCVYLAKQESQKQAPDLGVNNE